MSFLFFILITLEILHTKFGSLWTTPWPDKISIFLKIEKAKKSIFPIEIRTIFLWKLGGPFFLHYNLKSTGNQVHQFGSLWKLVHYEIQTSDQTWPSSSSGVKMGSSLQGDFSSIQKQSALKHFLALLEIRIILKNEPNRCILQGL